MNLATHTKVVRAALAPPVLLPMQQTLQIQSWDVGSDPTRRFSFCLEEIESVAGYTPPQVPGSRRDAVCTHRTALFASSEFELQTDLPFAARQELRDGAERGSL